MLAFDLQVIDPQAPMVVHSGPDPASSVDDIGLNPGDGGWQWPPANPKLTSGVLGAAVDLNYARWINTGTPQVMYSSPRWSQSASRLVELQQWATPSIFGGVPPFRDNDNDGIRDPQNEPYLLFTRPTYDTWPLDYEHDGVDQDGVAPWNQNPANNWRRRVDQGFNGFDDDGLNGVVVGRKSRATRRSTSGSKGSKHGGPGRRPVHRRWTRTACPTAGCAS